MATQFDYLAWRGDLTFSADKFNEVDGSILAMLSYINFDNISKEPITLKDAAVGYCPDKKYDSVRLGLIIPSKNINKIFCHAAESRRFSDCIISDFECKTSVEDNCQFAAVTFHLSSGRAVIAFRGTDDSLVGWREDCYLSFAEEIPSQTMALDYLERIADKYPAERIYLVGHSKGGNLALYSTVKCSDDTRARIVRTYCFDGPGLNSAVACSDGFKKSQRKLAIIVPQSSFIGTMFDVKERYTVVNGLSKGALQHDCFTWEVSGSSFVHLPELSERGKKNARQFKESMDRMNDDEKREFVQMIFSVVESTGAKTLTDFTSGYFKKAGAIIRNYKGLDKEKKELMLGLFLKLFDFKKQNEK